ncbi:MAG: penicillin-binding protein 1C [Lentisphaeria bacterium]|jgi:penicillin-binding protein 1C
MSGRTRTNTDRHGRGRRWRRAVCLGLAGGIAAGALFAGAWFAFPFPRAELERYPRATVLTDRTGAPLRVKLGPGSADCRPLLRPDPDSWIAKAVVATEDRRFWRHPGVDPLAILRAIWQNLTHRRRISGASTLTTQLIRQLDDRPRTLPTKISEAFRALQLERLLTKEEILEQYLNRVPFGSNLTGIEAASRRYFGKDPRQLSLAEAALLAGLPQSPTRLRPDRFPDRAKARQAVVLKRMRACRMITAAEQATALAQPLAVRTNRYPFRAPHFCDLVLENLHAGAPAPVRDRGDAAFTRRTTLDPELQRLVEAEVARHRDEWRRQGIAGAAVVMLEVETGAVRALVGSPDYHDREHHGQVNAALAPRSPGSALKPFFYALAMDQGRLTPGRVLADVPRQFRNYCPENFDSRFTGLVTAREALVLSLNLPALAVLEEAGQPAALQMLRRLGLDTLDRPAEHYGLGLAVGDGEVRLLDLANAYAGLARGGIWKRWRVLADGGGAPPPPIRVFSPEACWLVADMLGGDERAMSATGHRADVMSLPKFAWKTGTSAGFRDAWTIAWNPQWVIAVWLGNPDGRPAPALVGTEAAAPLAWELVRELYRNGDSPWYVRPAGVQCRGVCAVSGLPPGPHCPQTIADDCIAGVTRHEVCGVHRLQVLARDDAGRPVRTAVREIWPPEVAAFLAQAKPAANKPTATAGPRILSPARGTVFRLVDGALAESQRLNLLAAPGDGGDGRLFWLLDDHPLGESAGAAPLAWPLARGRHRLVCSDARGRSDSVEITVE